MESPVILVVEDNRTQRKVIELLADEYGFKAVVVGSCSEAMDALRENDVYALVLMDIRLPDTDGVQCAEELRKLVKDGRKIPMIAMTGHTGDLAKARFLHKGMDDYLPKPFTAREFRDMVQKWLRRQQNNDNLYEFPYSDLDRYSG